MTSDDPGHTYHVTEEAEVVATTEPQLLAPDSSVSKRALAKKPPSEQAIIAACQRFEIQIGNHMAKLADSTAKDMMARIKSYFDEKVATWEMDADEVKAELRKLGGDLSEQWAGRLPKNLGSIKAVLRGNGNIRESITLFNNFVRTILTPDLAKENMSRAPFAKLLPEVRALPGDDKARGEEALRRFNQRKNDSNAAVLSVTGKSKKDEQGKWKQDPANLGQQGETRSDPILEPVVVDGANASPQANPIPDAPFQPSLPPGQQVPQNPDKKPRYDAKTATSENPAPERENDQWWLHQMTVEEFEKLGGVLSEREKKLFNEGVYRKELAKRQATIKDAESFKKAVEEAEAEARKYVPWAAGFMGYDLKFDSANVVVDAFNKLSVPIGAGVSGTTARTMQSMSAIGIDATTGLKVCLGYLLPIQAHSFSEIRQAAATMGAGPYVPKRGSANYNQAPIKTDIEGMGAWEKFERQYNPTAIGADATT